MKKTDFETKLLKRVRAGNAYIPKEGDPKSYLEKVRVTALSSSTRVNKGANKQYFEKPYEKRGRRLISTADKVNKPETKRKRSASYNSQKNAPKMKLMKQVKPTIKRDFQSQSMDMFHNLPPSDERAFLANPEIGNWVDVMATVP